MERYGSSSYTHTKKGVTLRRTEKMSTIESKVRDPPYAPDQKTQNRIDLAIFSAVSLPPLVYGLCNSAIPQTIYESCHSTIQGIANYLF